MPEFEYRYTDPVEQNAAGTNIDDGTPIEEAQPPERQVYGGGAYVEEILGPYPYSEVAPVGDPTETVEIHPYMAADEKRTEGQGTEKVYVPLPTTTTKEIPIPISGDSNVPVVVQKLAEELGIDTGSLTDAHINLMMDVFAQVHAREYKAALKLKTRNKAISEYQRSINARRKKGEFLPERPTEDIIEQMRREYTAEEYIDAVGPLAQAYVNDFPRVVDRLVASRNFDDRGKLRQYLIREFNRLNMRDMQIRDAKARGENF